MPGEYEQLVGEFEDVRGEEEGEGEEEWEGN